MNELLDTGIVGGDFSDEFKRYHKLSLSVMKEFGFGTKPLIGTRISEEFEALEHFIRSKEGKEFDPSEMAHLSTYNIIKNILLGKRENYENGLDEILKHFKVFFRNASVAIDVAPTLLKRLPYFSSKMNLSAKSIYGILDIIEHEVENIEKNGTVECFVSSYIAKAGSDYDHEQLLYTIKDFIGAGFETTATTLLVLMIFIANNRTTQKRLQNEVDGVIPRHRLPTLDDQSKLPLVEATILETLRFRTVVPLAVPHLTLSDSTVCGYFIPAGTKASSSSKH